MSRARLSLIIMILCVSAGLCSCREEEPVQKSSFGQMDVMQDGDVLLDDGQSAGEDGAGAISENDVSDHKPLKTATQLDVNALPGDLPFMAEMCDAINMACVGLAKPYQDADSDFIWHCVHLFVSNSRDKKLGFTKVGDSVDADPRTVTDLIYAMFGKLRDLPSLAEVTMAGNGGAAEHVSVSNGLMYRFRYEDRGSSSPEIRRVTQYSDSSMEMEVALVDSRTGKETVSFIYTLRANTRDTSTSALFDYEITGARAADGITSEMINGTPYLQPEVSEGSRTYDASDPRYNEVEEILHFASFKENTPGVAELNRAIDDDLQKLKDDPPAGEQWHEIRSYPLTTDGYVQAAITYASYPSEREAPEIYCYVYDKNEGTPLDKSDAVKLCGLSEDQIRSRVRGQAARQIGAGAVSDIIYKGFLVRDDGSLDLFCRVEGTADTGKYSRLYVYNNMSGYLKDVSKGDVITEEDTDNNPVP